ncbi:hypothetical protein BS50DRAFT_581698 [Corynespora cassiicola Philippines]|uniref:Uncharacterized protein n=1 Tax=Corynespora cassiicola Philippines TaxID=1448308 RepID=A0A2T2PBB2_CORCC|nr:hypothetical protein BS50DRAFT_581698 [Corynespora cassiicola Philippines]
MADREETLGTGEAYGTGLTAGQYPHPPRRGTGSTVSSDKYGPMPPGFYTLPIHGNCPRCHHHHKAARIRVRITADSTQASHIYCERCDQRWLTLNGINSTRISLLSTQSTELDSLEKDFRRTLVSMVKSVTAIASPTLANIPESSSKLPSREHSLRRTKTYRSLDHAQDALAAVPGKGLFLPATHTSGRKSPKSRGPSFRTIIIEDPKNIKTMYRLIKQKFKERFPSLANFRRKPRVKSQKEASMATKGQGKLPMERGNENESPYVFDSKNSNEEQSACVKEHSDQRPESGKCTCALRATERLERFDTEKIKRMDSFERSAWVRQQVSASKCCCRDSCLCTSPPRLVDRGTQVEPVQLSPIFLPELHHRRSYPELSFLGSHFEIPIGIANPHPETLSIATRTSQVDTVVESIPATSAPRGSLLSIGQNPRHPPRSSRPLSIRSNSPQSWLYLRQQALTSQSSIDTMATGAAVRNFHETWRSGTERYSNASLAATIFGHPDSPNHLARTSLSMPGPTDSSSNMQTFTQPPTPHLNGYSTSDERNRT